MQLKSWETILKKKKKKKKNRMWMDQEDTKLGKEDISGSGRSMRGYNLFWSSPGFIGRNINFVKSGLIPASAVPTAENRHRSHHIKAKFSI